MNASSKGGVLTAVLNRTKKPSSGVRSIPGPCYSINHRRADDPDALCEYCCRSENVSSQFLEIFSKTANYKSLRKSDQALQMNRCGLGLASKTKAIS